MNNVVPKIVPARDKQENVFEAYELRDERGRSIFIDVQAANAVGGIERLRNGISPYHHIVCEVLT